MNISEKHPGSSLKNFPLSSAQLRLLIEHEKSRLKSDFNVSVAIRLPPECDITRLEDALSKTIRRHPALRTIIHIENGKHPSQSVVEILPRLEMVSLPSLSESDCFLKIKQFAKEPFDNLESGLLRLHLITNQAGFRVLQLVVHEIACDGASLRIVLEDLTRFYSENIECDNDDILAVNLNYRDYIVSHSDRWIGSSECESQRHFWLNKLDGYVPEPVLLDNPIRHGQGTRPERKSASVDADQAKAIRTTCAQFKKTPFVLMLAAYSLSLARRSTISEVIVSVPISARGSVHVQQTVGCFLNVVPIRLRFDWDKTVSEFVNYVQEEAFQCIEHAEFPFELFHKDFAPSLLDSLKSEAQYTINSQDLDISRSLHNGWKLLDLDLFEGKSNFCLYYRTGRDNWHLSIEFNSNKYECASADGIIRDILAILDSIGGNAEKSLKEVFKTLPNSQAKLSPDFDRTEGSASDLLGNIERGDPLSSIFDKVAAAYPGAVALVDGPRSITYDELRRLSNGMANALGPVAGEKIGIIVSNSIECVIGIIAILKAGAVYVPLDPEAVGRWEAILKGCSVRHLLAAPKESHLTEKIADPELEIHVIIPLSAEALDNPVAMQNSQMAYILHTSGSTGVPKGVMQTHRAVIHFIDAYVANLEIRPSDHLSLLPSLAYDAAVMDLYAALLTGATLHLASVKELGVDALAAWVRDHNITIWHSTPTLVRLIGERIQEISDARVRTVVFGGEEASRRDAQLAQRLFGPKCLLVNGYGPTESTVTLQYSISDSSELSNDRFPIGVPVSRTSVTVSDPRGVANTLIGELHLESRYIALGYIGQKELSEQRFGKSTTHAQGIRRYYTGDLVRIREDGFLEFMQREDGTTKVRGNLVSFHEMESWLLASDDVASAVVLEVDGEAGELVAFVVPKNGLQADSTYKLIRAMEAHLPSYMIPHRICLVDEIPMLQNNKIDRAKLLATLVNHKANVAENPKDISRHEEKVSEILCKLMDVGSIQIDRNIFDIGANSITILVAISEINMHYGSSIPITSLFEKPTIRSFCTSFSSHFPE